jgi:hypothetical protein
VVSTGFTATLRSSRFQLAIGLLAQVFLTVSEKTILRLHRLSRANIGDAGKYKEKNSDTKSGVSLVLSG